MKKFVLIFSLLLLAVAGSVNAQDRAANSTKPKGKVVYQDLHFTTGVNTIQLAGGAILTCRKSGGDAFSEVVYTDAAGKKFKLVPTTGGTTGAPQPPCKFPLPDACFATADKSVYMCVCKPTDLSNGNYGVSLLLPAIQKVREAANH
jgi:hypothetical protein